MPDYTPTDRTRVQHVPQRGHYDRETVHTILDEGMVCHAGFVREGQPFVIPMNYARDGERLLLHGGHDSRLVQTLAGGVPICLTVTLMDGLVIGRTPAQYSMNYRSVVVVGAASEVTDPAAKRTALAAFTDHFFPGRGREVETMDQRIIDETAVLEVPLREVSAKIRRGPISDGKPEAKSSGIWTGEIPLRLTALPPVSAPSCPSDLAPPEDMANPRRPGLIRAGE